jgi:regulator of sigma E protease
MIITLLIFAASILVLVGIHEAGHFLVARAFGVYIKEYAIGFGPKLFSHQGKETLYSLRLIPFGGYVRMAGEDRLETDEDIPADRVLYSKPPYARALITLAGPFANLLLAFAITLAVVWAVALPMMQVTGIVPNSPASSSLQFGDRILSIDGQRILTREQISDIIERSGGNPVAISLVRGEKELNLSITPEYVQDEDRYVVGAYFYTAAVTNEISSVGGDPTYTTQGIQDGDRIVAVNGEPMDTFVDIENAVDQALPASQITVTILRDGASQDTILSTEGKSLSDLFSTIQFADLGVVNQHAGLADGVALAAHQFVGYIVALANVIHSVVVGQMAAGDVFEGPVGVAQLLGQSVRIGASFFFQLLAFLSLNFGLINLIPFPALDGSRAVFALYEWIRRKPISPQREGLIHAIGFVILIGLMILITYRDIVRLFQ